MAADDTAIFGGTYTVYQGADKSFTFTLTPAASVVGQMFEVRIVDQSGNYANVVIAHGSLTITTATGVITVTLTHAITTALIRGLYDVELWRIDNGNENKLEYITIEVRP